MWPHATNYSFLSPNHQKLKKNHQNISFSTKNPHQISAIVDWFCLLMPTKCQLYDLSGRSAATRHKIARLVPKRVSPKATPTQSNGWSGRRGLDSHLLCLLCRPHFLRESL